MNEFSRVRCLPRDSHDVVVAYPPNAPWIGVLRHPLGKYGLSVVSADDLAACRRAVRERARCLLLIEVTPEDAIARLELVDELRDTQPRTRIVLLLRRIDDEIERMLREIGACDVIRHPSQYHRILQIARSHARSDSSSEPTPTHSYPESP